MRRICERCQGVEIIEANACEDHIHMLVTIPPKMSVSKFMGILKGNVYWKFKFIYNKFDSNNPYPILYMKKV